MARTTFVDVYIRRKGRLILSATPLFRCETSTDYSPACLDQASSQVFTNFAFPSSTLSLGPKGPPSTLKGLMKMRRLSSTSIAANRKAPKIGRRCVYPFIHCMYMFLTYYKGQEVVRGQHMLPHRSQLSYCLFASWRSRLLHHRLFSRHKPTRVCPSHIRILSWICIWTLLL